METGFAHPVAAVFVEIAILEKRSKMLWMEVFSFVTSASLNVRLLFIYLFFSVVHQNAHMRFF